MSFMIDMQDTFETVGKITLKGVAGLAVTPIALVGASTYLIGKGAIQVGNSLNEVYKGIKEEKQILEAAYQTINLALDVKEKNITLNLKKIFK